jgi:hypothetical protein
MKVMGQAQFNSASRKQTAGKRVARHRVPVWPTLCYMAVLLMQSSPVLALTITGVIINRTTNQPSVGDRVVLYRVERTMHEEQHATSDQQGGFRFERREDTKYLVAALHHGISYHTVITSGIEPLEISVFDTVTELRGIHQDSDTLFFGSSGSTLAVTEFLVFSNRSNPPRTLAGGRTLDFALPGTAVLDSVTVQPPSTLPHMISVLPQRVEGRYAIAYPIRPGTTKVRVVYHVPYSGSVSLGPAILRPIESFAVEVPPSMQVNIRQTSLLEYQGEDNGLSVYVARDLRPGRSYAFTLSGIGQLDKTSQAPASAKTTQLRPATDYTQEFFPPSQPKKKFVGIASRTLAFYYEIPVLLIAIFIGIGALVCRVGDSSKNDSISGPSINSAD